MAEWRDRQILAVAALVNQSAIDAREAFEREVEQATAAETIFNPAVLANARIDALLGGTLGASLTDFLGLAANELASIDDRLSALSDVLRRADTIVMPLAQAPASSAASLSEDTVSEAETLQATGSEQAPTLWRGLSGVPAMLARRATSFADDAGSAADDLLQDKLGLKNRLRTAAAQRVAVAWMGGTGEPKPVLAQLVALIDETTHAARMSLS